MKELINSAKDFKIIPDNFKSSGEFKVLEVQEDTIKVELNLIDKNDLEDYKIDSNVEVFGVNALGLLYFETNIIDRKDNILTLATTPDYSIIQRREYSRVYINTENIIFKDIAPDCVLKMEDISAGGMKFISNIELETDKYYDIEIKLSNNMRIECAFSPIRAKKISYKENEGYEISGKFVDLENADRIVLVQYAFKIKMEEQSKEN